MKRSPCETCRNLIARNAIHAPLSGKEREQLQAHLAVCSRCRTFLSEEQHLSELLEDSFLSSARGNSMLSADIHAALPEQTETADVRRFFPAHRFLTLEAAAAVVLFLLGIGAGWLISGSGGLPSGNTGPAVSETPNGETTGSAPSTLISTGSRNHTLLPENKLKTSDRRRLKFIFPGESNIRIEINHEASLMEELAPDHKKEQYTRPEELDKRLY